MHKLLISTLLLSLISVSSLVQAREKPLTGLYTGAGLTWNQLSNYDDAVGANFFIGSHFKNLMTTYIQADLEVGYFYSGDFTSRKIKDVDAKGFWVSGLVRLPVTSQIEIMGRLGADFGDDNGLLAGVGLAFNVSQDWQLRLETVQRDNISSIQLNTAYHY